jgi:hypothetical protein
MLSTEQNCPEIPVKFPVSSEFYRRLRRAALRRQPSSAKFGEFPSFMLKKPANGGLL